MRFGAAFPLVASRDLVWLRDYAQAIEEAGFDYAAASGHVLASPPGRYSDRPTARYAGPFYDPFVLFSYAAAITRSLRFRTGVLILPMFPTALVAKQAAELSYVSGGRFDLGVGVGSDPFEYGALNQDLHTRGRRLEEQISVLRLLWTQPFVSFHGRWHHLDDVGLNCLPETPIPIWIGCAPDDRLLRRVARLADGWMPEVDPTEPVLRLRQFLKEEGRDPAAFGMNGRIIADPETPQRWLGVASRLKAAAGTHLTIAPPHEAPPAQVFDIILDARKRLTEALGD